MPIKALREKIKFPTYWAKLWNGLSDKSIGKLAVGAMRYGFLGECPDVAEMTDDELSVWHTMKRDLDYQFTHKKACRYPVDASKIRNSEEYRQWRIAVFERDRYTCQVCGQVGRNLNAHHIRPFAKYPELRLDLNNGITLCKRCHDLVHGRRGKQ